MGQATVTRFFSALSMTLKPALPDPLPDVAYSAEGTRAIDRAAIDQHGIPALTLMQRAAAGCFGALRRTWPGAKRVAILCGTGNNGGDGFVIAELARRAGLEPRVCVVGEVTRIVGTARLAFDAMRDAGVGLSSLGESLVHAEVIVDALFGTGLSRPLTGPAATAVEAINRHAAPVLAVDLPSGLHADHGTVDGHVVQASLTCTFIALKTGLLTSRGPALVGRLEFYGLDVPPAAFEAAAPETQRIDADIVAPRLPARPRDAHKGSFGHLLLVGGDRPYAGAILLATRAALRTGAGLVSAGTHPEHAVALASAAPEAMFSAVRTPADLERLAERASSIAVGPGLGTAKWGREALSAVLALDKPTVIDADALNVLATSPSGLPTPSTLIVTPHPGEAARLLDTTVAAVQSDRLQAAQRIARALDAVCILKGAGTVIAHPRARSSIATVGNPGLAAGGSGDVLTGVAGALLAQGPSLALTAFAAAELAVCVHGAAADYAAAGGERGMTASDVIDALRIVVNPVRGGPVSPLEA
ncbi:MAG: NAD(P)H-hydrate dehydratase [Pseudomonadota bacterium]